MEQIKIYIDNAFAGFPQTDEVQLLKRDMLDNMEEKYIMLRQSGKSEHEAAYNVIANFGDIGEITAELGLAMKDEESGIFLSYDEVQDYLSKSKKSAALIGFGCWLIIAGVASVLMFDNVFCLFPAIAIAVAMFIVTGYKMSVYEHFQKTPIRLDDYTRELIENLRFRFMPRCTAMIVVGVVLIILAAGAFTVVDVPIPLFLNIIGFSVFLFIIAGSNSAAYDVLLGKGDYGNKTAHKQAERIVGFVASVYWPVVTAIFLMWSFIKDAWGSSWIIWPVAGVLFGAISGGIYAWFGITEKERA